MCPGLGNDSCLVYGVCVYGAGEEEERSVKVIEGQRDEKFGSRRRVGLVPTILSWPFSIYSVPTFIFCLACVSGASSKKYATPSSSFQDRVLCVVSTGEGKRKGKRNLGYIACFLSNL